MLINFYKKYNQNNKATKANIKVTYNKEDESVVSSSPGGGVVQLPPSSTITVASLTTIKEAVVPPNVNPTV